MPLPKAAKGKPAQSAASISPQALGMAQLTGITPSWLGYGNTYVASNTNVLWQDTTSNATYCSAASALGGTA